MTKKTQSKKRKGEAASIDSHESDSNSTRGDSKPRPHSIIFDPKEKVTKPSFANECDINRIIDRYQTTGLVTHTAAGQPQYGEAPDQTLFEAACVRAELNSQVEEGLDMAELEKNALEPPEEVSDEIPPISAETDETASESAPENDESRAE